MARPSWIPEKFHRHWDEPWKDRARESGEFRKLLDDHGYLTPHFKKSEARCKDARRTAVPKSLLRKARDHAFNLERLRHRLGDVPIQVNSWYRTKAHNSAVGGAPESQHLEACATDHTSAWVDGTGRTKLLREAEIVFADGGLGTYSNGSVHFDSRGERARW